MVASRRDINADADRLSRCSLLCQVRRLVYRSGSLWAGDELGSVCRWARDLSSCQLKQGDNREY